MWTRRIDLHVVEPMLNGFRAAEGFEIFKSRLRLLPQAADDLKRSRKSASPGSTA